jgi:hypothetical protein
MSPPQAFADHDHIRPVRPIVGFTETPPDTWRNPEHLKVARADALTFQALWLASADDRRLPGLHDRRGFE